MTDERLTCQHCGSVDLVLIEVTEESHTWDGGLRLVDGEIRPVGEAFHCAGDILTNRTQINCQGCGGYWKPRRRVGMPYEMMGP